MLKRVATTRRTNGRAALSGLVVAVVLLAGCASTGDSVNDLASAAETETETGAEVVGGVTAEPTAPIDRPDADEVLDSIVRIIGLGCRVPAIGTGFAVDENLIITNAHIVAGRNTESLAVQNLSGDEYDAVLIGFDPDLDLALLRVDDASFSPLNLVTEVPIVDGVAIGLRPDDGENVINEIDYTVDAPVIVNWDGVFKDSESRFRGLRMLGDIRQGDSGSPLLINDHDVIGLVQSTTRNQPQGYAVGAADISEFVDSIGPSGEATEVVSDRCA